MGYEQKKKTGKISNELLLILLPMIAVFIIAVAGIIFSRSKTYIIEEAQTSLQNESEANAKDISALLKGEHSSSTRWENCLYPHRHASCVSSRQESISV